MRGQSDAAQKEMEEVSRELREDDEELRVRFRKDSKSEDNHGSANVIAEIVTSDVDNARNRAQEGKSKAKSYFWRFKNLISKFRIGQILE